jgi:hypothetical protein
LSRLRWHSSMSASLSGKRRCLSSRLGTTLEKGLNLKRPSLMARLTAATSHRPFCECSRS